MKEIPENEVLRFTRKILVPKNGSWDVALLCRVEAGERVIFRSRCWTVETVNRGEFCGSRIYQARLTPELIVQEDDAAEC